MDNLNDFVQLRPKIKEKITLQRDREGEEHNTTRLRNNKH
jgi:hypothetical protein